MAKEKEQPEKEEEQKVKIVPVIKETEEGYELPDGKTIGRGVGFERQVLEWLYNIQKALG